MKETAQLETAYHPATPGEPLLRLDRFGVDIDGHRVLSEITLDIPKGCITALIGPSGSGKTVLLRSFNRMNEWTDPVRTHGTARFEGQDIHGGDIDILELRSRMGMVFRTPNPFAMSIYENVAYPLRVQRKLSRRSLDEGVERALRRCGLWNDLKDRLGSLAAQLPTGLQQRVCVARALAASPSILLLDEPCSVLDPVATAELEDLLLSLEGEPTVVIVTHNPQQASRISDHTAFLSLGHLIECGPTERVFQRPLRRETDDYISGRFG